MMRTARVLTVALAIAACVAAAAPAPASASVCGLVGWVSGAAGKACGVVTHGDKLINAGKKLATGHIGGAAKALLGSSGGGSKTNTAIGLAAIGAWVLGGAKVALHETVKVLGKTTSPQLGTTWFSSTYWRMAAIAAVLTLPFLFAAAVQALMRSDLALLARAALGYLPLSLLAVSIAAPLTMLLLAACDEMSAIVSSAAGHAGTRFLTELGLLTGGLVALTRSPFLAFLVGLLTAAGAIVLWVEMLMREAAVYIVVLMLPLAFAALVWPARRVWAVRAVELLIALILSKFAIVAVLALGAAALGQRGTSGAGGMLTGLVLVVLGAFAPWALVRLLPLAELASGATGQLRGELSRVRGMVGVSDEGEGRAADWAGSVTSGMRREAEATVATSSGRRPADDGATAELEKLEMRATETGRTPAPSAVGHEVVEADRIPAGDGMLVTVGGSTADEEDGEMAGTGAAVPACEERLPGMPAMYQAADGGWRPIVLGPEESRNPQPLWPPGDPPLGAESMDAPQTSREAGPAGSSQVAGSGSGGGGGGGEDHDPRPPEQRPEDGSL
jgi:hypothetical protein